VARGIFSTVPILLKQPHRPENADQPVPRLYFAKVYEAFAAASSKFMALRKTGIVTHGVPGESRRAGSCGNRNLEVIIANDHDEPVAPGEVAEALVRPKWAYAMLTAYYNNPEATTEALCNLWFKYRRQCTSGYRGLSLFRRSQEGCHPQACENISSSEGRSDSQSSSGYPGVGQCRNVVGARRG
jgi:crotonobetaine/carnitine-CoA ligase